MTSQDKYPKLFQFLKDHPGPSLVYVTLQRQAEEMADDLVKQGFDAEAFHAGSKQFANIAVKVLREDTNNMINSGCKEESFHTGALHEFQASDCRCHYCIRHGGR